MICLQNMFLKFQTLGEGGLKFPENLSNAGITHALGAVDWKHVQIVKPNNAGSCFYNYKHPHSIILLVIAGQEYECLYTDVGYNNRINDSGIWNKCSFLQVIDDGSAKLPKHN